MNGEYIKGDCLEHLAGYADNHFDLAICDPPYGSSSDAIGKANGNKQAAKRTNYRQFKNIAPTKKYFNELLRVSKSQIIWGCNFFDFPLIGGRIVWDKLGTAFGRAEIAFCSLTKSVNIFQYRWNGMLQQDMKNKEHRIHPTQKPVALYRWLLQNYAKPNDLILDTHVGSASSLIACEIEGFKYVGFEKDPEYYEQSKKRIKQHLAQKVLF